MFRMALVVNESVIEEIVDVLDASGIFKKNSIRSQIYEKNSKI